MHFLPFVSQDSSPRKLRLNITRTGGLVGDVAVNVSVVYHLPGSNSPSNEVMLINPHVVKNIADGSKSALVEVEIANNGFISLGAAFKAELTNVNLQSGGMHVFCFLFLPC